VAPTGKGAICLFLLLKIEYSAPASLSSWTSPALKQGKDRELATGPENNRTLRKYDLSGFHRDDGQVDAFTHLPCTV